MPDRPHHSEKMKSCVEKVMAQGHDESAAYAICTTSLQEAGTEIYAQEAARHLHLCGATGQIRFDNLDGREHLVIPVVALMEGVIHAVNSENPEFVPLSTLHRAASTWNGRPIVVGHPVKNGRQCSANQPDVQSIGTIFNTRVEGRKMLCEAWIDTQKAKRVNLEMYNRLAAGRTEEVSVGAYVVTDGVSGKYNGQDFRASWLETIGDHLAFLPGGRGACSVEMGCGTNRAAEARAYLVTAQGFEALGGPGSGNFGHSGRPGEIGGSGDSEGSSPKMGDESKGTRSTVSEKHSYASDAHHDAAHYHREAAKAAQEVQKLRAGGSSASSDKGGRQIEKLDKAQKAAEKASKEASRLTKASNSKPYASEAASSYSKMATKGGITEAVKYHTEAAKLHEAASKWHMAAEKSMKHLQGPLQDRAQVVVGSKVKIKKKSSHHYGKTGSVRSMQNGLYTVLASDNASLGEYTESELDTPEQAQSEEAAELISYETMRVLLDQAGDSWDEMSSQLDELIAAESEHATDTKEESETEIECARLCAIQAMCTALYSTLSSISASTQYMISQHLKDMQAQDASPRYMEAAQELKVALGSRNNATDKKSIQAIHDFAMELGAQCKEYKEASAHVLRTATIRHEGGKWVLYSKDGTKKLGVHDSKSEAEAQEVAIERAKMRRSAELATSGSEAAPQPTSTCSCGGHS